MKLLVLVLAASLTASAGLDEVVRQLRDAQFDPEACYRVHDLKFNREDVRFYLNSGFLILLKPIEGRHVAAVFTAETETGDAEILLIPPTRSERTSLASFTKSPNLNEHFQSALFLFSDDTANELLKQIEASEFNRKAVEDGARLAAQWNSAFRNLSSSFEVRLLEDLLVQRRGNDGFFFAAMAGKNLGNFDFFFDPRARDQITLGQISNRSGGPQFDYWTHFPGRNFREGKRKISEPEFRITDYRIESHLLDDLQLKVTAHIKLTANRPLSAVPFDLSQRMDVSAAEVNGVAAQMFRKESLRANLIRGDQNEVLLVVPTEPLVAGVHEITIHHQGHVIGDAGNNVYFVASRVNWYPQRGNNFANYDLIFRFPKRLGLVSSGELVSERIEGEEKVSHRRSVSPIRYAGFNLGDYVMTSAKQGEYQVDVYANRNLEKDLALVAQGSPTAKPVALQSRPMAQEIADYFAWLASKLGSPPQRVLSVSPIPGQFGQGFSGLLYLSTLTYLNLPERSGLSKEMQTYYSSLLQAHETAHQWWGNSVTSPSYEDDWLQEALANYLALLLLEQKSGTESLHEMLYGFRDRLLQKSSEGFPVEATGPVTFGARLQNSQSVGAWRTIVYDKGTWIIHMLRRRLGDDLFWALLTDLTRRYQYQTLSTQQFQQSAKEFLSKQPVVAGSYRSADPRLEIFFDTWVYGTGIPDMKMEWSVKGSAPKVLLRGTITQSEVPDEFMDVVPVEIQFVSGRKMTHWVRTSSDSTSFELTLPSVPRQVRLDPENAVLRH